MAGSKDHVIRTGYWHRLEWPCPGGILEQFRHVVEIFNIIKDEEMRRQASKIA